MDRTSEQPKSAGKENVQSGASRGESGSAQATAPEISVEPTEAEVEAWAERVRLRRQAWVDGPTEEEKNEWIRRERMRRLSRLENEVEGKPSNGGPRGYDPYAERRRLQRRYLREVRLATQGLGVWMAMLPFRTLAELVASGREWEEETLQPARRRWIPFNEDEV